MQIEHHKRIHCHVCNIGITPYEAYHIDALRKHFMRHHEPLLHERGTNVEKWRHSCAAIPKRRNSAAALAAPADALAAAAATAGGGAAGLVAVEADGGTKMRFADGEQQPVFDGLMV